MFGRSLELRSWPACCAKVFEHAPEQLAASLLRDSAEARAGFANEARELHVDVRDLAGAAI
eukprot:14587797-Alexandrium_andersonii.AAC.1